MDTTNLLIVATDFKPNIGGMAEYIHNVATHLQLGGDNVTVLAPQMENDAEFDRQCCYQVQRFHSPKVPLSYGQRLLNAKTYFQLISKAIHQTEANCLFYAHYMWLSPHCLFASKISRIPYVTAAYGLEVSVKTAHFKETLKRRLFFRNAAQVICISEFTRKKVLELGVSPQKTVVIPCGVDSNIYRPKCPRSSFMETYNLEGRKTIFTLARLVERKGIDKVIEAMPAVLKAVPDVIYIIAGSGPYEQTLKNLVDKHHVQAQVIFVGNITEAEKIDYYNICDLFVMPARELENGDVEGFGIVYLEANACGKPVIGGRSGGVEDAILDGETGTLVDPLSVEEIARAIVRLLRDKAYATELGRSGRCRVENELNWQQIAKRLKQSISISS